MSDKYDTIPISILEQELGLNVIILNHDEQGDKDYLTLTDTDRLFLIDINRLWDLNYIKNIVMAIAHDRRKALKIIKECIPNPTKGGECTEDQIMLHLIQSDLIDKVATKEEDGATCFVGINTLTIFGSKNRIGSITFIK